MPGDIETNVVADRFIKSDLLQFLKCKKSAWLKRNKPNAISWPLISSYESFLSNEGLGVEKLAEEYIASIWPEGSYAFQMEFEADDGFYTRSDIVKFTGPNSIEIYEVKASTSLRRQKENDPILDATFQRIVVERAGYNVDRVTIIHLNKEYIRIENIDPSQMLSFTDVTELTLELRDETIGTLIALKEFLAQDQIEETDCECLYKPSKSKHCESFEYFNQDIPTQSVYWLPRFNKDKLSAAIDGNLMDLSDLPVEGLTERQKIIVDSAKQGAPQINLDGINAFFSNLSWPLHFYDYETVSTAIPLVSGLKPFQQVPVQFSLHVMTESGELEHYEFLSKKVDQQAELITHLKGAFHTEGSVISWNKPFENSCNVTLASLYPDEEDFLLSVNGRTIDLMDVFKKDYVDVKFQGSTSIKKVLPVICPHLLYNEDAIHEGAGAMAAFLNHIDIEDINEKNRIRSELRDYCELDTFAMVEIFGFLKTLTD